jgi:Tfp pilus tip-associated adhesin PilY1
VGAAAVGHDHESTYAKPSDITTHNSSSAAHSDIRAAISAIESKIPTVNYPVTSVNSKTGAVSLTYSDVGADMSGSAAQALIDAKAHTDTEISDLASNVASLIETAVDGLDTKIAAKADSEHTHDGRYYTKTEIDNLELITIADIDTICGSAIKAASEVTF